MDELRINVQMMLHERFEALEKRLEEIEKRIAALEKEGV